MTDSPLICLACIVGNEADVIERFIRAFRPAVDSAVFVIAIGAQEQDLSDEVIRTVCRELDLPHQILVYQNDPHAKDWPHVDSFSRARELSWTTARATGAQYLMWADCDDMLEDGAVEALRSAAAEATADIYLCPYNVRGEVVVQQQVIRERLVKASVESRWIYPLHEQLSFANDITYRQLPAATFLHRPMPTKHGGRERNRRILGREIEQCSRNYFYLHQEAFEGQEMTLAKTYGRAALASPKIDTLERYEILLNLAQAEDGPLSKVLAAEAFTVMPDRREALALLCSYAIVEDDVEKALQLATLLYGMPRPKRHYWSLNNLWYSWRGSEIYAQCLRLAGGDIEEFERLYHGEDGVNFSIIYDDADATAMFGLRSREWWLTTAQRADKVEFIFKVPEGSTFSRGKFRGFRHWVEPTAEHPTVESMARGKVIIQTHSRIIPGQSWDAALAKLIDLSAVTSPTPIKDFGLDLSPLIIGESPTPVDSPNEGNTLTA